MTVTRNDPHRPSAINPADYRYVAQEYINTGFDIGACMYLLEQRAIIQADMARTGGTYAAHQHGGNCMCCGSVNAIYTTLFHHAPTNTYVRFGSTCAIKLDMGDERAFRAIKAAVKDARDAIAGKQKAQSVLADAGLSAAWVIGTSPFEGVGNLRDHMTVVDMVNRLVKYGSLSEKQIGYLRTLVERIQNAPAIEAARAAEKAAAADAPTGKGTYDVEVLKIRVEDGYYGRVTKMLVKHASGWTAWGTCPSMGGEYVERGMHIELKATFERARDDSKHAFFKRPSGKVLV